MYDIYILYWESKYIFLLIEISFLFLSVFKESRKNTN